MITSESIYAFVNHIKNDNDSMFSVFMIVFNLLFYLDLIMAISKPLIMAISKPLIMAISSLTT